MANEYKFNTIEYQTIKILTYFKFLNIRWTEGVIIFGITH